MALPAVWTTRSRLGQAGSSLSRRPLVLVVDAAVAVNASYGGLGPVRGQDLVTPPLMWAEARSALHQAVWRGEVSPEEGLELLAALQRLPIRSRNPTRLGQTAWRLADELGWAKTYDAEYLALAELLGCRVVTVDNRLRRGADRLGLVVLPTEL
jgi:predicted nucleic acid-binding protein